MSLEPVPATDSEKNWAIAAHLAPVGGYFILIGQILLPLGILLFGPKSAFVQAHAKESLNAQISYTIYGLVLILLVMTRVGVVFVRPLGILLFVLVLWNMVAAALAAGRGEVYAYRFILRLIP